MKCPHCGSTEPHHLCVGKQQPTIETGWKEASARQWAGRQRTARPTNEAGELRKAIIKVIGPSHYSRMSELMIDKLVALHQAEVDKAVLSALAKHVLAGMPELTPRQQEHITRVLEELNKGGTL